VEYVVFLPFVVPLTALPVGRLAALLFLLLGCLVFSGFASLSPARGDGGASSSPSRKGKAAAKPRVVLILTGGLRWDQLDQTIAPNLARLGASGTMANLVPVSTTRPACPVDTWLAMSAGRQISSGGVASTPTCTQPLVAAGAPLPAWGRYRAALAQTSKRSHLGQFAELAPAFVFLASAESSYVSGETLNVNGGMVTP